MPLITPTPQPVLTADIFEVTEIDILAAPQQVRIYYTIGATQADKSVRVLETRIYTKDASKLGLAFPDGTKTWYANLKALAYQILQQDGQIPTGTVS